MYRVGIDLGGTKIAVGVVSLEGKIMCKESIPTNRDRNYKEIIKDMAFLTDEIIKDQGYKAADIKSIGIGMPGTIDSKQGVIIYSNNLKFNNVPIVSEINNYLDYPVYIENDANCAALAENIFGAAKGAQRSITITIGTGIGSGIIINGEIYTGFNLAGGELGHTVICVDGELCTCGRRGCWETYASASAIIKHAVAAAQKDSNSLINIIVNGDLSKVNAKVIFDAAASNDKTANDILNQFVKYLAEGATNVINIFQPEVLVIGGGISKQGDRIIKPLREMVSKNVYCKEVIQTEIKIAELGNDAGIVGAALLGKS